MEHMLFKGTPDMDALGVAQAFEHRRPGERGHRRGVHRALRPLSARAPGTALDIMSDMVLRPTLADLEREREVIVEEIRMYEDRPTSWPTSTSRA